MNLFRLDGFFVCIFKSLISSDKSPIALERVRVGSNTTDYVRIVWR